MNKDTFVLTSLGMVSSLGYDVVTSCAASRAGLTRSVELEYFSVPDAEDGKEPNVVRHPVPAVDSGFQRVARLVRIALPAFEDVLDKGNVHELDHSKTGLYLSLPDFDRIHDTVFDTGSNEEEIKKGESGELLKSQKEPESLCRGLFRKLTELSDCPIPEENWNEFNVGHAGVALAIEKALKDLKTGRMDHCLIGGVDSLLEEETLEWLINNKRLKTEENPVGFQPGESAAFILLERLETADRRKADISAALEGVATGFETDHLFTGKPALGTGLSETVSSLMNVVGENEQVNWIVSDQNGEIYRASEWGNSLVRLSARYPALGKAELWYPAASFGDTAAASGAVAICCAAVAFERGYNLSPLAIILSCSDKGERGVALLSEFPAER